MSSTSEDEDDTPPTPTGKEKPANLVEDFILKLKATELALCKKARPNELLGRIFYGDISTLPAFDGAGDDVEEAADKNEKQTPAVS